MLEKLSSAIKKATDKIANAVFLDEKVVDSIVKELQRSLIEADVNVSLVLEITKKLKQAAYDERIKGVEKKEHLVKILHDELLNILGKSREIKIDKNSVFMLVGLYGSGKTTTISKLASYYGKRGHSVCAVGLDVYRPAAAEQLKQLCNKLNITCFIQPDEKDPKKIWKKYEKDIKKYSLVLVDTAGRDSLDEDLIKEIKAVGKLVNADETFLVISADIGQTAKKQAQAFKEAVGVTGVIITKMDSTARAGGALTACHEIKAPVVFIGTGEKPTDIEQFNPEAFLSRLLGMGDLQGLLEKVHSALGDDKIKATQDKLKEGKFTLKDFQSQLDSMESIGGFDKIMSMIPGLGQAKIPENVLEGQKEKTTRWKNAINSMTKAEQENPELLEKQTSRMQRIAKGSGTSVSEIRSLIKQYKVLNEMIKSQSSLTSGNLDQKTMIKFAKKFGRKLRL